MRSARGPNEYIGSIVCPIWYPEHIYMNYNIYQQIVTNGKCSLGLRGGPTVGSGCGDRRQVRMALTYRDPTATAVLEQPSRQVPVLRSLPAIHAKIICFRPFPPRLRIPSAG